ncbi:discoidin domain-containing protein [Paenibacillus agaridevorans]|uniref:discoidin domain-containing protein n=1 Tax=Paenibacillus agaridevorans TaxID=171404 RepID=UPI001FE87DA7|nr:discoidin domain-containing protein [Paenibacillus agaridevorans]
MRPTLMNAGMSRRIAAVLSLALALTIFAIPGTATAGGAQQNLEEINVALNRSVVTSDSTPASSGYAPEEAVDGIGGEWTNGWSPVQFDVVMPWLQIDLGQPYEISRVQVDDRPYDGLDGRPAWDGPRSHFEIRASNDPEFGTYSVLGSVGGTPYPGYTWSQEVTDTEAYRYIRYARTIAGYTFLSELKVLALLEPGEPGGSPVLLYVSPDGNDNGDGSLAQPFRTLQRVRDEVRTINADMDRDIVVYLRDGQYELTDPLTLGVADSGTNGYYVTYRNYPGETPVISGAQKIGGWTEQGEWLKTNVGSLNFRDLWVNGRRALRARTESFKLEGWDTAGKQILVESAAAAALNVNQPQDVELVLNQHWTESMARINAVSTVAGTTAVSLASLGDVLFTRPFPDKAVDQSVHFENAYEFADQPGEWFLDRDSGDLFYRPRDGETAGTLDARMGLADRFIAIQGHDKNNPARNIRLQGLTFEYTKYQRAIVQNGMISDQGGLSGGVRQPSAVYLKAAHQIRIEGNVFRHFGAAALDLDMMTQNNVVEGNAFLDIGGSGIVEGVFDDLTGYDHFDELLHAKDNRFANNYMNGIGVNHYGSVALLSGYAQGSVIEHNEISNTGYSAISAGWGWTANPTTLKNTKIRYNNVYHVINRLADGGAIYTLSHTPGAEMAENFIHDIDKHEFASRYFGGAIYLDQETKGYVVRDNAMTRIGGETNQIKFNAEHLNDNVIDHNGIQDTAIINNAGLKPEYWDMVPRVQTHESGNPWTATEYGSVKIAGTVQSDLPEFAYSIRKNSVVAWSGEADGGQGDYVVHIDLIPGDVISFEAQGNASWSSRIKPETYPPRLAIEQVSYAGQSEPATISDQFGEVYVKLAAHADPSTLALDIDTPFGTELELLAGGGVYRDYRVYMAEDLPYTGFAGERKHRDWRVYLIPASNEPSRPEEVNVALHKQTSIPFWDNIHSPYSPARAVDGIGGEWTNGWHPSVYEGVSPWLQIDLGDEYVIHRIQVDDRPYDGTNGPGSDWDGPRRNFEIRASNDPNFGTYTVLGAVGNEAYSGYVWSRKATGTDAYRYIRYVRTTAGYMFLSELSVYALPEAVNVAWNKSVATSDTGTPSLDYGPEKAVDGIGGEWDNGWSPVTFEGISPWLQVDLGDEYVIQRVQVDDRPYDGQDGRPDWNGPRRNFEIRASNDPNFGTYAVLGSVGNTPYSGHVWSHAVTNTNAFRYIRYARTDTGYTFLSELRVFAMVRHGYNIGGT